MGSSSIQKLTLERSNRLQRRYFYNRIRLIQQGLYVYGPTDAEKDRAEKLNEEGISLLPEREDRLSVWAKNYFINRAFVMGISMDIMQVDDVVGI